MLVSLILPWACFDDKRIPFLHLHPGRREIAEGHASRPYSPRAALRGHTATSLLASLCAAHVGLPSTVIRPWCSSMSLLFRGFVNFLALLQSSTWRIRCCYHFGREKKDATVLSLLTFGSVSSSLISLWLFPLFWCTVLDGICSSQFALLSLVFIIIYAWNFVSYQYRIQEVGACWLIAVAIVWKCVYRKQRG